MRRLMVLVIAVAAAGAMAVTEPPTAMAGGGSGSVVIYPFDCPAALQDCIDNVSADGIVTVATDGFVDEDIEIAKSIVLNGAVGWTPTIKSVSVEPATGPVTVAIERLAIREHVQGLFIFYGGGLSIHDSKVGTRQSPFAVSFLTTKSADLTVIGSVVRSGGETLTFAAQQSFGTATLTAIANRITHRGAEDTGAGIYLDARGTGSYRADLMNNVIWDVARCDGSPPEPGMEACLRRSAIHAELDESPDVDVNVVGNTIERSRNSGIALRGTLDPGGSLALDVFDNIISHHPRRGIDLDVMGTVFRAGYNDLFAVGPNDLNGGSLGPGTLAVDPRFIDRAAGKLQLRSTSPLIDKGVVCSPGGVANPDADGNHRLRGPTVDIGAYERGAAPPTGEVRFGSDLADDLGGTNGADIICGNGGPDDLGGSGGPDYLDGGGEGDFIVGGSGNDRLYGRAGADRLCAADGIGGNDLADGGKGVDRYSADPGDTLISVEQVGAGCM
jgi:Ca2+-binding RTX toxin-like protein